MTTSKREEDVTGEWGMGGADYMLALGLHEPPPPPYHYSCCHIIKPAIKRP